MTYCPSISKVQGTITLTKYHELITTDTCHQIVTSNSLSENITYSDQGGITAHMTKGIIDFFQMIEIKEHTYRILANVVSVQLNSALNETTSVENIA